MVSRLDKIESRQEEISKRLDDLSREQQTIHARLNSMDQRLDNLYQVVVRRDEYSGLEARVRKLEELLREKKLATAR